MLLNNNTLSQIEHILNIKKFTFFFKTIFSILNKNKSSLKKEYFHFLIKKLRKIKFSYLNKDFLNEFNSYKINFFPNLIPKNKISLLSFVKNKILEFLCNYNFVEKRISIFNSIENTFDYLLFNQDHPSRTKKDTFFVNKDVLIPHVTVMEVQNLKLLNEDKINIFCMQKVFRRDDDPSHLPSFTQIEIVSSQYDFNSFTNLIINIIRYVANSLSYFSSKNKELYFRVRPHYFPYTCPSGEIDIYCCNNDNCSICSAGWIELLGFGCFVDEIFEKQNMIKKNNVWATGIGVERIALSLHNILFDDKLYRIKDLF